MNRERLKEIKQDSKDAFNYMKSVEKEYLKGKNLGAQTNFILKFGEIHSLEDLDYLYNELEGYKEERLLFTNGIWGITLPSYAMVFSILGVVTSSVLALFSSALMKVIDVKLTTEATDTVDALNTLIQSFLNVSQIVTIASILAFIGLSCIFVYMHYCGTRKRIQYLSWLKTIKARKAEEKLRNRR